MTVYDDPVRRVREELEAQGVKPSAVNEACSYVSQEVIAGNWLQIEGQAIRKETGRPAENVAEYVGRILVEKPNYKFELAVADDADLTFLGDGKTRTAKAAGEFVAKYGEATYHATAEMYGVNDKTLIGGKLKAGTKPGPDKNKSSAASTNPWAAQYRGDEAARIKAQTSIIRSMGTKVAAGMAKAAGCTLGGQPLRGIGGK